MAKTTIGALSVRLSAQTAAFSQGLQTASKKTKRFRAGLLTAGTAVAAFSAATVTAAAYGLARLTRSQMSSIDTMAKLSDITGATTQDIAALRFAGELAGASNEKLDKALKNFTRRLGEAKTGTGEAVDGLNMLGLSANKLSSMGMGDAFGVVADRINVLPTAADKAQAAYSLLGRSGLDMMNLMMGGSKAIDDARKKTLAFGTAIDRGAAAKVEAANDAVTLLQESFKGVGVTLAVKVAPYMLALVNRLTQLSEQGLTFVRVLQIMGTGGVEVAAKLLNAMQSIARTAIKLQNTLLNVSYKVTQAMKGVMELGDKVNPTNTSKWGIAVAERNLATIRKLIEHNQSALDMWGEESLGVRFKRGLNNIQNEAKGIADEMMRAAKARADLTAAAEGFDERGAGRGGQDAFRQVSLNRTAFGGVMSQRNYLQKLVNNTQMIVNNTRLIGVN